MNIMDFAFVGIGFLISTFIDTLQLKKMKEQYETKIETLEKDIKILKGSKKNGQT